MKRDWGDTSYDAFVDEPIEGMCFDCKHHDESKPHHMDYSENVYCPKRKADGSCWEAYQNDRT